MLEGLKPVKPASRCKLAAFQETLEDKDQKLLEGYIADLTFSAESFSDALKLRTDADVGATVIRKHRKKQCSCAKLN